MSTIKYHLLLDRHEYTSTDISKLEPLLEEFTKSEGQKSFFKSSIVSINEANDFMKQELWIENDKYNGENVTFIHWYNNLFYIIQTK